jgi:hypothetical protein
MYAAYDDIRSRIAEEPSWYDENGSPRYGVFSRELCPNIYAHEVVLLRIACQACGRRFDVEMNGDTFYHIRHPKNLHYGDAPRHDGCAGDTMNCEDLAVLEVWQVNDRQEWIRRSDLEGLIDDRG